MLIFDFISCVVSTHYKLNLPEMQLWVPNSRIQFSALLYLASWSFIFLNIQDSMGTETGSDANLTWQIQHNATVAESEHSVCNKASIKKNQFEKEHFIWKVNFQLFPGTKIYFFHKYWLFSFSCLCGLTSANISHPHTITCSFFPGWMGERTGKAKVGKLIGWQKDNRE